jgi:hypothetical protein
MKLIICILALSIQSVFLASLDRRHYNQQGFRTLSYDSAPQRSLTSTFVSSPKQTTSIKAAPLSSSGSFSNGGSFSSGGGYGQSNQVVTPIVTQPSSNYGQSNQFVSNQVVTPFVDQSSSQSAQVLTPIADQSTVQVSSGSNYGQSSQVVTPVVTPTFQQSTDNGYGQQQQTVVQTPVFTQQTSSYGQQSLPVTLQPTVQSSYGQQPAVQVVAPVTSSYGQQSPMTLFMSQPAIQQLISTMVAQYHGNQLGASQEMANTCSIGFTQPIYESNQVTETYCRCPTGTYGFSCTENFANPCMDGSIEFTAADSRVPSNYFLKCSWGIPYLNKCPMGTVRWSQELHACVADDSIQVAVSGGYSSGGYGGQQQQIVNTVVPTQTFVQQTPVSFSQRLVSTQSGGY